MYFTRCPDVINQLQVHWFLPSVRNFAASQSLLVPLEPLARYTRRCRQSMLFRTNCCRGAGGLE